MKCVVQYMDHAQDLTDRMIDDFTSDLQGRGVDVLRVSYVGATVDTPHVFISFITDLSKLRGRKFDEMFGVPIDIYKYHIKEPGKKPMSCEGLFEYVLREEGII